MIGVRSFLACGLMLLSGCVHQAPVTASQYRPAMVAATLALRYAPSAIQPVPDDVTRVRALGGGLPAAAVPRFIASGPLLSQRAQAVELLLGRPVEIELPRSTAADPDSALLIPPALPAIIAMACLGHGERLVGDMWPGDDEDQAVLMPPGCATATAIAAQIVAPEDLLQGRPLPPGAASPFVAAIERYYRRNDTTRTNATGQPQEAAQGTGSGTPPAAAALMGPLSQVPSAAARQAPPLASQ
jgi:hypothetical protein